MVALRRQMAKNRDYTGLVRTPASMAWLIRHRAKTKGRLDALKALAVSTSEKIAQVEAELAAIDAVIPHHEVKVDPLEISGIRRREIPMAPYGLLGRSVLRCLRNAAGKPVYTSEIAWAFATDAKLNMDSLHQSVIMDRVKDRLGLLLKKGIVRRHHALGSNIEGSWSLIEEDDPR